MLDMEAKKTEAEIEFLSGDEGLSCGFFDNLIGMVSSIKEIVGSKAGRTGRIAVVHTE